MAWLTLTHTQRRHAHRQTVGSGHVYQGRFKSFVVQSNEYFLTVCRYVERNPGRTKRCRSAKDHRWPSARFHLGLVNTDPLIKRRYKGIGTEKEWKNRIKSDPKEIKELRHYFKTKRPYGSERFLRKAEHETGRELILKKAGRPNNMYPVT